jgi:hypothetical protein
MAGTTLASPEDAMLERLRIECFYPADAATELAVEPIVARSSGRST